LRDFPYLPSTNNCINGDALLITQKIVILGEITYVSQVQIIAILGCTVDYSENSNPWRDFPYLPSTNNCNIGVA
jgi:hypothetical protein